MRRIWLILLAFLVGILSAQAQFDSTQLNKLIFALNLIHNNYVDSVKDEKLTEDAINGILKKLDPHSTYIPASKVEVANEGLRGNFEGVGIEFSLVADTLYVTGLVPNGPSEKAGILPGDRIIYVDTENIAGIHLGNDGVAKRLRGEKGSTVHLRVMRREVDHLLDFTIVRDKIPLFSVVAAYMCDSVTAYIRVNRFANATASDLRKAMMDLRKEGAKQLILDLRDNSGGYLSTAISMADEFLDGGKRIVYTRGLHQKDEDYYSHAGGTFEKGKLIVLINEGSASASEIFAGAMQDNDRALLVGRKSYGKGLVQKPTSLPDGSQIRLTIARYYTPSGRCIQRPYNMENDQYFKEFGRRMSSGELMYRDSVHLPDSLRYLTLNGRTVYAAGGIMPDVFVAYDTSYNSSWLSQCLRNNLINSYCLHYTDEHRKDLLTEYPNIRAFNQRFQSEPALWHDFLQYAETKKIASDNDGQQRSKQHLLDLLKATIANYLWDLDAYYEVFNQDDPIYNKALELMKEKDFSSYGIR